MVTMGRIKRRFGGLICRSCIRQEYNARLRRANCRYLRESATCPCCGEVKHIVRRLTLRGYLKTLFNNFG